MQSLLLRFSTVIRRLYHNLWHWAIYVTIKAKLWITCPTVNLLPLGHTHKPVPPLYAQSWLQCCLWGIFEGRRLVLENNVWTTLSEKLHHAEETKTVEVQKMLLYSFSGRLWDICWSWSFVPCLMGSVPTLENMLHARVCKWAVKQEGRSWAGFWDRAGKQKSNIWAGGNINGFQKFSKSELGLPVRVVLKLQIYILSS